MNSAAEIKDYYGKLQFYINGEWADSRSTTVGIDTDPATGEGSERLISSSFGRGLMCGTKGGCRVGHFV